MVGSIVAAMSKVRQVMLLFLVAVTETKSARILAYFPTPSISHQVVFRPITQELAKRGHEVIVVTPNPVFTQDNLPINLTEIDVREVSYRQWNHTFTNKSGKKIHLIAQGLAVLIKFTDTFDLQMQTQAVQNMLRNKDKYYFDILLLEACNRPLLGFASKFDAPVILLSSLGAIPSQFADLGAPSHSLLYPTFVRHRLYNLSFWERSYELIKQWGTDFIFYVIEFYDFYIAKKHFGNDLPPFHELKKKVQMLFLNEHPVWAENRPVPTSIQFMGGIHKAVDKNLPQDLQYYLDFSEQGVIYVSFGTNVLPSYLPPESIKTMTEVFSQLPYNILWKWDTETLPGQSKNINISSWYPQTDVLRHPNVKLFITQGGLQSTDEAINAGVPLIGIPMILDQWYNTEKYVHHRIGKQLDLTTMTKAELKDAIHTVINNKSYKDNIVRLKTLMRSYPIKPLDNVIWWIEHVIANGGRHLQSPSAHMTLLEYYEVELLFKLLATVVAMVLIIYILKLLYFSEMLLSNNKNIKIQ